MEVLILEIRPSSDLRNHYPEISKFTRETSEPVFITKNGHGDTVVLSIDLYKEMKQQNELYESLHDAVTEYLATPKEELVDTDTVFQNMKSIIKGKKLNV